MLLRLFLRVSWFENIFSSSSHCFFSSQNTFPILGRYEWCGVRTEGSRNYSATLFGMSTSTVSRPFDPRLAELGSLE